MVSSLEGAAPLKAGQCPRIPKTPQEVVYIFKALAKPKTLNAKPSLALCSLGYSFLLGTGGL